MLTWRHHANKAEQLAPPCRLGTLPDGGDVLNFESSKAASNRLWSITGPLGVPLTIFKDKEEDKRGNVDSQMFCQQQVWYSDPISCLLSVHPLIKQLPKYKTGLSKYVVATHTVAFIYTRAQTQTHAHTQCDSNTEECSVVVGSVILC